MSPDKLRQSLERNQRILQSRGYDVRPLIFESTASLEEVAELEVELGFTIPATLRELLLKVSKHVEFRWFAPDELEYPAPFESNFSGDLHWSLEFTAQFNSDKNDWVSNVFPDSSDSYDAVWHDKLAFYEVGNGDYLAIDLSQSDSEHVVYLSHDDGEGHGHRIADNVIDLLERWVPLGCTGGEDWQWLPFTKELKTTIDPTCNTAKRWKWILGIAE